MKLLNVIRTLPYYLVYLTNKNNQIITKDLNRWIEISGRNKYNYSTFRNLNYFLCVYPEFRNIFCYRIQSNKIAKKICELFHKPLETLYITTPDIGEGLFIQHGFSTIIAAKSIGKNCWINQQVTIGYSNEIDHPVIGDNVTITSGAKIIGNVKIGDNAIIGANAVVVKDIPANCTVVGNPSFIVKKNGEKVREYL